MRTLVCAHSSTAAWSATYDGQITISVSLTSATCGRKSPRNASASSIVLCIFQFAAMTGVR
jgi:hypothetical protein